MRGSRFKQRLFARIVSNMSRNKHRGSANFLDELQNAEHYAAAYERERRHHEAMQSMSHSERIQARNNERAKRSDVKVSQATYCQMPDCKDPALRMGGRSLGICYRHGVDVATYFDIRGEDFQQQLDRVARIEANARQSRLEEQRAESRRNAPGWIYYILVGERIKIGYSMDVKRRLKAYPPDTPLLAMHPGTKRTEQDMHSKFAGSRAAGREWFLDAPEIREHIKQVIDQFGEPDRARYEHRGQRANPRLKAS